MAVILAFDRSHTRMHLSSCRPCCLLLVLTLHPWIRQSQKHSFRLSIAD